MPHVIDRTAHDCAEEIFNQIGTTITELQIYTREHPRFTRTAENLRALIQRFFDENPGTKNLTITIRRKQVEFRGIPFVDVNSHGQRLIRALDECHCQGLRFRSRISTEEIGRMIETLIVYTRPSSAVSDRPQSRPGARYTFLYALPKEEIRSIDDSANERSVGRMPHEFVPEFRASAEMLRNVSSSYQSILGSIQDGGAAILGSLLKTISKAIGEVASEDLHRSPAPLEGYFDEFTAHHSANVCLLTTRAASLVIKDPHELQRIGVAALLHDIGKSRVATAILDKPGRLDAEESDELRRHDILGAEILLGLPNVDPLCVTVAYGHHLRHGPDEPERRVEPDWVTRLVAVADIFETLTAVRPYKRGMSVEGAFRAMAQMASLAEHRPLVKLLYESLGPYPVGTFVELNSGERGVVLATNRNHPTQPTVRILTGEDRAELPEALDLDLAEASWGQETPRKVTRALVRQRPEDDLLEMVAEPDPEEILGWPLGSCARWMEREG